MKQQEKCPTCKKAKEFNMCSSGFHITPPQPATVEEAAKAYASEADQDTIYEAALDGFQAGYNYAQQPSCNHPNAKWYNQAILRCPDCGVMFEDGQQPEPMGGKTFLDVLEENYRASCAGDFYTILSEHSPVSAVRETYEDLISIYKANFNKPASQWRETARELPEERPFECYKLLVYGEWDDECIARYQDKSFYATDATDESGDSVDITNLVTHWMYLPEPPTTK